MPSPPRLLMLGLDGGDLDFIRSRSAKLPTLGDAIENWRLFEPEAPRALSGSVWPTFYTGSEPGEHGIYQHLVWDPQRMGLRRIDPSWCLRRPFWAQLEARGQRVVAFDVPYSFPVNLEKGIEITDWATHGQTHPLGCNDRSVLRWLRRLGPSPMGRETPIEKTERQLETVRRSMVESAALKARAIVDLMSLQDWDTFIAVFGEVHRAGHVLWSQEDERPRPREATALLEVYRAVDEALSTILAQRDSNTSVVLFSVHGMATDHAQGHAVRPVLDRVNEVFVEDHLGMAPRPGGRPLIRNLREWVPARLQHAVGSVAPDSVRQWVVEQEIVGGLDWSRTPGFALRTDIRTELRLNLRGREAHGLLDPNGPLRERYVATIRESFLGLTDAETGQALVEDVLDVRALHPGANSEALPDLVITWRAGAPARRVLLPSLGEVTVRPAGVRGGDHTDLGFALWSGVGAREAPVDLARTTDFAALASA